MLLYNKSVFFLTSKVYKILHLPVVFVIRFTFCDLCFSAYSILRRIHFIGFIRSTNHLQSPTVPPCPSLMNFLYSIRRPYYFYKTLIFLHRQHVITLIRFMVIYHVSFYQLTYTTLKVELKNFSSFNPDYSNFY